MSLLFSPLRFDAGRVAGLVTRELGGLGPMSRKRQALSE